MLQWISIKCLVKPNLLDLVWKLLTYIYKEWPFFFLTMVTVCDCVAFLLNQNCWFLWETKSKKLVFCNTSVIIYYTAGLLLWRLVVRKHNYYYKRRVRSTWPAIGHQHFYFISHGPSTWCWWLGVISLTLSKTCQSL